MIYFLIVLCIMDILDQVRLFLINMCCYCSGSGREKKVVDKYELLYSEYENLHGEGFSNLEIYDIVYCR